MRSSNLTPAEAAEILNVTEVVVRGLVSEHILGWASIGGNLFVHRHEVESLRPVFSRPKHITPPAQ